MEANEQAEAGALAAAQQQAAEAQTANCPHCRQPLTEVGWTINGQAVQGMALVVFFHNGCKTALNLQFLPTEQPRVQLANTLPPRPS